MKNKLVFGVLLAALLAMTTSVYAEDEKQVSKKEASKIERIVVTAQKKEQSIYEIPFAISAFGEDEIKKRGATDIKDLQYSVPGLSITGNTPGQDRVQIRGASSDTGLGSPTVGRYLDEVSVSSDATQRTLDVPLLDMKRVEVLRGPQGTLHGSGSIGGTIKLITNSPDLSDVSGSVGGNFSTIKDGSDGHKLNGVLNLPIVEDVLAVRIAASTEEIAGWIDNTATGESDINEASRDFVRTKVLFKPNDTFNASLMWMHYDFEQGNSNRERSVEGLNLVAFENRSATDERTADVPFATPLDDKWDLLNLILNVSLENADIISSTGYLDRSINQTAETVNAFFPPGLFGSYTRDDTDSEVFTQEIRVSSSWDNPLNYTIGAFYRSSKTSTTDTVAFPAVFPFPPQITNALGDSDSSAVFGELSYNFTDTLTGSVGLRYFKDDQKTSVFRLTEAGRIDASPPVQSFDALTPRFNLLWKASDKLSMYGTISKGFRSGGINGAGSAIIDFDPEEVWVYEIGGRGEVVQGRVYFDAAVYYSDYDDIQVSVSDNGRARTTNGGSASGMGVDLSAQVYLTDALIFDFSGGYVGREYDDTVGSVAKGDSSQYTPDFTLSAALDYNFEWSGDLGGMARLAVSHADGFTVTDRTLPIPPLLSQVVTTQPLTYLGFRIGVIGEEWRVIFSAENLLDEKDEVFPGGAFSLDTYSRPPSLTIEASYNF